MGLDTDIRGFWPYSAASIPANWSRDTDFDERFLQGSTVVGSGGVANHTHVADAHTHTGDVHTHTTPSAAAASGTRNTNAGVTAAFAIAGHTHAATITATRTLSYNTSVVSLGTDTAQPAHMKVILIKPDDSFQEMPDGSVGFFASTSIPTGFQKTDGTGGAVDLSERFLLGADAAGDGGGTGGSETHTHVASAHLHSIALPHVHATIDYSAASSTILRSTSFLAAGVERIHHTQSTASAAAGSTSSDVVTVDSASSEPAFTYLRGIQNISGGDLTPDGVILPFVGGTVPDGWTLCDGSNGTPDLTATQVKVTMSPTLLGTTGGSDSDHLHTTQSHGHTHTSGHFHAFSLADINPSNASTGAFGVAIASIGHTHLVSSPNTGSTTPTLRDAGVTLNTSSGKPLFRTVKFIRKGKPTVIMRGGTVRGATVR